MLPKFIRYYIQYMLYIPGKTTDANPVKTPTHPP